MTNALGADETGTLRVSRMPADSVEKALFDETLPHLDPIDERAFDAVFELDRASQRAVVDVEVGEDLGRVGPLPLCGVLVDGVERNVVAGEPCYGVVEQSPAAHRVENHPATVADQFPQHGNGADVVADMGVGVRNDRTVEVDGDNCIPDSHCGITFYRSDPRNLSAVA